MRLGLDTEDKFLIKLNEINEQIQDIFLAEAKKISWICSFISFNFIRNLSSVFRPNRII